RAPDPAAVVARGPRVERVHLLELPDARLFHRFVLVDGRAERRARAEAELLHHPRTDLRAIAIRRDVNHVLHLHVVAQSAALRPLGTEDLEQETAHALAPHIR